MSRMNGISSDLPPDKDNGDCQGRVVNVVVEVIIEAKTRSDGEKGGSQEDKNGAVSHEDKKDEDSHKDEGLQAVKKKEGSKWFAENKSFEGVEIVLKPEELGKEIKATTDEEGKALFENVPKGDYKVVAKRRGFKFEEFERLPHAADLGLVGAGDAQVTSGSAAAEEERAEEQRHKDNDEATKKVRYKLFPRYCVFAHCNICPSKLGHFVGSHFHFYPLKGGVQMEAKGNDTAQLPYQDHCQRQSWSPA